MPSVMEYSRTGRLDLGWWFAPALVCSLVLNIAALGFPFMHMKTVLMPAEDFTLFASVHLLWSGGLYALAVLVVVFSVIFPFAKLAAIVWVWREGGRHPGAAEGVLRLIERLGKWSMLDVFLVALMISLTSSQWIIKARAGVGVGFFLVAIVLSMLCGSRLAKAHGHERHAPPAPLGGALALLCVCLLTLVPLLRVESFWLRNSSLTLVSATTGLAGTGAWGLSIAVLAFLVLAPLLQGFGQLGQWRALRQGRDARPWTLLVGEAKHWSLLDVFALALMIFLIEGRHMVPTSVQPGCWILVLCVGAQVAFGLRRPPYQPRS